MLVNAFTLIPKEEDEERVRHQLESFYLREPNLRKNISLHVSLMLCSLSLQAKEKLLKFLNSEGFTLSKITASIGNLQPIGDNYIGFSFTSDELIKAHLKLLEAIKPFTAENFNPKYLDQNLSPEEKKYLHQYGYHRVKEFFKPHLTIGKYETTKVRDEELKIAPKLSGTLTFDSLTLDEVEDGSMIPGKILWEMKLKK